MLTEKLDNLLRELIVQWNIAEERIKKAENVRANEVVASAIFELRYAGRKMIDAFDIILNDKGNLGAKKDDRIIAYFADATEDCVKSKHDAIDSMINFVTDWFNKVENSIGLAMVVKFFPDYLTHTSRIKSIQDKIAKSRADRSESRDGVYNEIDSSGYTEILELFERMLLSNNRVEEEVAKEQREKEFLKKLAVWGVALGIVGAVGVVDILVRIVMLLWK
jgi:preprotein translocase subunit Sss1